MHKWHLVAVVATVKVRVQHLVQTSDGHYKHTHIHITGTCQAYTSG